MELLVVVFILSVLAGLAAISYSATEGSLAGSTAQDGLAAVGAAETSFASDYGTFTAYPSDLSTLVPRTLTLTDGASTGPSSISLALGSDGVVGLAALSSTGSTCQAERITPYSTTAGSGGQTTTLTIPSSEACDGANALASGDTAQTPQSELH